MAVKILLVAGARPNFMKVAPLVSQLTRCPDVQVILVHTGQHYDPEMSDAFFRDLGIPAPDVFLGVGSGSHAEQTAKIMVAFETVILEKKPDAVVVVGDVNSTLACSLVTAKIGYPVGSVTPKDSRDRPLIVHVEAGLRSFDRSMPEEINRIVTDALSDLLLTASRDADENLKREGIPQEKIFFVGNVMIDTLLAHRERAGQSDILPRLGLTPERKGLDTSCAYDAPMRKKVRTHHPLPNPPPSEGEGTGGGDFLANESRETHRSVRHRDRYRRREDADHGRAEPCPADHGNRCWGDEAGRDWLPHQGWAAATA